MADEHETERALMLGDLAAGDFSFCDEPTLRNGIAFHEYHLAEIVRQAERRLRAHQFRYCSDTDPAEDFRPRFDAMRGADIAEAIQMLGVPLQKRGREWTGLCPFHEEKTPSFSANREKGLWCCRGCQRGGDLVRFVVHKSDFTMNDVEALRFLEATIDVPGSAK